MLALDTTFISLLSIHARGNLHIQPESLQLGLRRLCVPLPKLGLVSASRSLRITLVVISLFARALEIRVI